MLQLAPTFDRQLGQRLRDRRLLLGVTQTALGEAIGVSFQQVQKYENGVNRLSAQALSLAARKLNTSVAALLHGLGEPPAAEAQPGPRTHRLKCWPTQFAAVLAGDKTFEIRLNDRDFRQGDFLLLEEWDRLKGDGRFTGRTFAAEAGVVLCGGRQGFGEMTIAPGHCVISLLPRQGVQDGGRA